MSWRWVFLINLPVGILSFLGVYFYIRNSATKMLKRFDWFGFSMLALAIGLLQLLLDRGEQQDWFGSIEIRIEAIGAVIAFVYFLLHTVTDSGDTFFNTKLLKDRNFVTGLAFYFLLGLLLYATRALLPPLLQNLMNYPVTTTGLVTAPSGLGTMIAMLMAGRMVGRMDSRLILALGFGLTAVSLWQMSEYAPQVAQWNIIWPGFIQGMGIGFTSVPLTTMTFSTLDRHLRSEGTAIYSLSRNIGSSIGISVMQTLLVRNTATMHSSLAEHITPGTLATGHYALANTFDLSTATGMAALNSILHDQASFIAYMDDFRLMFWMTLLSIPCLWLMREKKVESPVSAEDKEVLIAAAE
jgi:DHA2 family multidrug resistance protein